MKVTGLTPVLNVSDVVWSIHWFLRLGWHRGFTWNDGGMIPDGADANDDGPAGFAGVCASSPAEGEGPMIFLCRDGQGARDPRPCPNPHDDNYGAVWMSWWVADVDQAHADAIAAGGEVVRPPQNEPWGVREFLLRHPDGHYFRVSGPAR